MYKHTYYIYMFAKIVRAHKNHGLQRHCKICMASLQSQVSELGHSEIVEVQLSILVCLGWNWGTPAKPKVNGPLAKVSPAMFSSQKYTQFE